ncbi:MAG: OB-fold domain-containing protein [Microthrixaceae bacterium]|nr:OB-fold domain-containing protein [Microthrixaceae bacterium]
MQDASFGPHGVLWSYSVQNYPPPPPARYDEPYVPYALGVVDLTDGLRVVGRMAVDDPGGLVVVATLSWCSA